MGKTVRELREQQGLTQAELAHELGIAPSTIYTWESGKVIPSVKQLRHLAEFFKISSDDIALIGLDLDRPNDNSR